MWLPIFCSNLKKNKIKWHECKCHQYLTPWIVHIEYWLRLAIKFKKLYNKKTITDKRNLAVFILSFFRFNTFMFSSSVARHTLFFSLHVNRDDIMSHMRSSTKASQTCCIIKSFAPSQLHGLPQTHSVTATITVGGKGKSHLKALSSQVIYVALMMKAVTQAGWAHPPPLSLC